VFGALKKLFFSKGSISELNQCLKAFDELPTAMKIEVANYVLNFIAETNELSTKVSSSDVLAVNLGRFAFDLREARVAAGGRSRSDTVWLAYALCESYAISFSPRLNEEYRSTANRVIKERMQGVFSSASNQKYRLPKTVLPRELREFVMRH
jgi:hypothetical protein